MQKAKLSTSETLDIISSAIFSSFIVLNLDSTSIHEAFREKDEMVSGPSGHLKGRRDIETL